MRPDLCASTSAAPFTMFKPHFFCIAGLLWLSSASVNAQPAATPPLILVKPVIATIQKGDETVAGAWQKGKLNAPLVLAALSSGETVNAGIALPSGDMKLARDLAATLVEQQPAILEKPQDIPSRALLHLANFLESRGDERAVPLYEEVLKRQVKRSPTWPDEVDATLYNLGEYYASTGDIQKAIDTRMRIYDYTTFPPLLANYELLIARLYSQKGDDEQAGQWYEAAEDRGTPRAIGVARMDRAGALFGRGKTEQARALLLKPLGKMTPEESQKEPIQIALLTRVAQSYYPADMETAKKYLTQALKVLHDLPTPSDDPYVVAFGPMAQRLAQQIETRQKSPFFWQQEAAAFYVLPRGEMAPQRLVLQFKSAPKGAIEWKCDNPALRIEPVEASTPGQNPLKRVVYLSLNSNDVKADFSTSLVAHLAEFPDDEARLPIRVQVLKMSLPAIRKPAPPAKAR